jgi:hypothetical protein
VARIVYVHCDKRIAEAHAVRTFYWTVGNPHSAKNVATLGDAFRINEST